MVEAKLTEGKQPPKASQKRLVKLYANYLAARGKAQARIEDRLYREFISYRDKLAAKYPDIDFNSGEFFSNIESYADRLNAERITGPGITW
jgi:hypothetical protein